MRRLLCAALALTLAAPALAGRMVIWKPSGVSAAQADAMAKYEAAVLGTAVSLGIDYDYLPQQAAIAGNTNQNTLRTLTVTFADGSTRSYDGQLFMGWAVGASGLKFTGFNPDTLTLGATWPSKPTAFLGLTNVSGGSIYNSTATCTTGVTPGTSLAFFSVPAYEPAQHMTGKPYVWKGATNPYYYRTANAITVTRSVPGVLKPRVVMGSSSVSYRDNGLSSCTDCDSVPRGATYASAEEDTAIIWTRQRTTTDAAVLVFAPLLYTTGGGPDVPAANIAQVFAIMDSASGGRLIGQRRGWKPLQSGIGVADAFTRSVSAPNGAEYYTHGLKCVSGGNCDSTYWKAGRDSLQSLGLPYTVWCNTDSIGQYPYEKVWWAQDQNATFAPAPRTQLGSGTGVSAGAASRYLVTDAFGGLRARVPITSDRYASGTACDGTDTTMSCLLSYARALLDSVPEFRGRMSAALFAPHSDYIPANYPNRNLPPEDSLCAAMLRSGFRVAVTDVLPLATNAGASWGLDGSGNAILPTGLTGGITKAYRAGVYRHRVEGVGTFSWASTRRYDEDALFQYSGHSGTMVGELLNGALLSDWYPTTLASRPYYYHAFKANLNVLVIRMGDLGFQRNTTDNPVRPGWYMVKHYVNTIRSINEFAGRTVWRIVPVDQL